MREPLSWFFSSCRCCSSLWSEEEEEEEEDGVDRCVGEASQEVSPRFVVQPSSSKNHIRVLGPFLITRRKVSPPLLLPFVGSWSDAASQENQD